jgi:hypothetical protein
MDNEALLNLALVVAQSTFEALRTKLSSIDLVYAAHTKGHQVG